jgi:TPR repeat protein
MAEDTPRVDQVIRQPPRRVRPTRGGLRPGGKLVSELKAPPSDPRSDQSTPSTQSVPKGVIDASVSSGAGFLAEVAKAAEEPTAHGRLMVIGEAGAGKSAIAYESFARGLPLKEEPDPGKRYFIFHDHEPPPTSSDLALLRLGGLCRRRGKDEEALSWFRRAADSGNAEACVQIAEILERRGQFTEAEQYYRMAVDLADH